MNNEDYPETDQAHYEEETKEGTKNKEKEKVSDSEYEEDEGDSTNRTSIGVDERKEAERKSNEDEKDEKERKNNEEDKDDKEGSSTSNTTQGTTQNEELEGEEEAIQDIIDENETEDKSASKSAPQKSNSKQSKKKGRKKKQHLNDPDDFLDFITVHNITINNTYNWFKYQIWGLTRKMLTLYLYDRVVIFENIPEDTSSVSIDEWCSVMNEEWDLMKKSLDACHDDVLKSFDMDRDYS